MDFLSRAYAQASELFKSMTMGARITSGLLLAVIVISLAYLVQGQVSGPDTYLFGAQAFSSAEITTMEGAFSKADLSGYLVEGSKIRIPRGEQAAYVAALAEGNVLPANFSMLMEDLVSGGSPFESEKQRQQRVNTAKQRLLSLAIKSMTGIDEALVLFDIQEGTGLARKKEVTASVSVRCTGNQPMEEERVPAIRHLVVGAIAGLTPEKVSVTCMNSGHTFAGGTSTRAGGGILDDYSERKRFLEREYTDKIRNVLHHVRGVTVATDVTLDTQVDHKEVSTTVDPKPVTVDLHTSETTSNTQSAAPGGRPGLAAQQGGMNQGGAVGSTSAGSRSDDESREERQRSLVGTKQVETRKHGLTPERVTAAIGIPSSHYENIWLERNPTPPGEEPRKPEPKDLAAIETEETKNIRDMVLQLIPLPPGVVPDVTPLVTVRTFQHIRPPAIKAPGIAEDAVAALGQYWSSIGLALLGLFSLLMLRSMIRSVPMAEPPAPITLPFPTEEDKEDSPDAIKRHRRTGGEADPREDLMDIVREDPDAAANILRNWISNAG